MSKKTKRNSPVKDNEDIVRAPYQKMVYTDAERLELYKCFHPETGPRHFIENYVYVQHVKHGKVLMRLYPYQVGLLDSYHNYRNSISMISRQMGKSTMAAAYLLWYAMFNDDVTVLIASNKHEGAMEIMHRIRYAYENVPDFLRAGVVSYNKKSIAFDNGSRIISQATTQNTGRGLTISLAYIDEFSFVAPNIANLFWTSISPTLSTGGKCIITSTPNNDEDQFAEIWFGALDNVDEFGVERPVGKNGFRAYKSIWSDHPERDQKWADEELGKIGTDRFEAEHLCLDGATKLQLLDENNTQLTLTIEDLFVNQDKALKVLTDQGYKTFAGVTCMGEKEIYRLETTVGSYVEATHDHKIYVNSTDCYPLDSFKPNDFVWTQNGPEVVAVIENTNRVSKVYDLVEVDGIHRFYGNGILVSNCEFVTFEEVLIPAARISQMKGIDAKKVDNKVRWYKDINPKMSYVVGYDPAMGTGGDFSAIQVFELETLEQVAEWSSNRTAVEYQVKRMQEILKQIEAAGATEIFWSIENNSVGEAALLVVREVGEDHFPGEFIHEPRRQQSGPRRKGFTTGQRSKLESCAKFKSWIESEKMQINSRNLISELKTFVAKNGSYEAKIGSHDDLVMATLLCVRIVGVVAQWDDAVHNRLAANFGDSVYDEDDDELPLPVFF